MVVHLLDVLETRVADRKVKCKDRHFAGVFETPLPIFAHVPGLVVAVLVHASGKQLGGF